MGNHVGVERKERPHRHGIDWDNAERPSPPGKPYLHSNDDQQPDLITIRWSPPESDGGARIRGYLVEHRRTGSPHWLRASPYLARTNELILSGLEPGWRYQFRVSAENDLGLSDPGEVSEPLTVTLQSAATAPHFNRELCDIVALENEKVEFTVHVVAIPPPKISWYKDGFEIFSSRRTKIITDNESSTFIIHQAALEDEGEIKCTATNRAGHIVTKAYLKLEAPPRIRLPKTYEDGLIFEKGEVIRLKVSTAGRPTPMISWFHDGSVITTSKKHEISTSDGTSCLRINEALREDRGEYAIRGENKIGVDTVAFLVTVTDRPSPPGRPKVVMTLGKSVTLTWTSPEDDGGCKVGNYFVEYFRVGWGMWLKATTSRNLTTTLTDMIEGSEYRFRIKAENPYGVSEPSEESEKLFIPDPKRGVYKPTDSVEDSLHWLEQEPGRLLTEKKRSLSPEDELSKKRKMLEEKASRLLDNPLPIEKQKYQFEKKRNLLNDDNTATSPPVVPKRRRKKSTSLGDSATINSPPTSPKSLSDNEDSFIDGSSELMLVILPEENRKSSELTLQQRQEIERALTEEPTAPPISLSAPELGTFEPMVDFTGLRDAVSSSELLYEKAVARLYKDSCEQNQRRKSLERRPSLRETTLERRHSLKENNAAGLKPLTPKKPLDNEARSRTPADDSLTTRASPQKALKSILKPGERLSSVEREQLEFAKIRDGLRLKNSQNQSTFIPRPPILKQSSYSSSNEGDISLDDDYTSDEDFIDRAKLFKEREEEKITQNSKKKLVKKAEPEEERDTYHPRSMIPTRSLISKVIPKITINEEGENAQSYAKKDIKKPEILKKIGNFKIKNNKKPSAVGILIADTVTPMSSIALPKPILKNKPLKKKGKETSKEMVENSDKKMESDKQKKQVRIAEPFEQGEKKKITRRQESIEEEQKANMVVINHYSDIVREFGAGKKRSHPKLYLNFDELEAHAEHKAKSNEATTIANTTKEFEEPLEKDDNVVVDTKEEKMEKTVGDSIISHEMPQQTEKEILSLENHDVIKSEMLDEEKSQTDLQNPHDNLKKFFDYFIDVALFLFACWLFVFKNEIYCIPVLILLIYRQLSEVTQQKFVKVKSFLIGTWMTRRVNE